jgi:septation ring formation regulator EzrA
MTDQQFQELKSLIRENTRGIQGNAQAISRNYEMIGRIYSEHGGRLEGLEGRLTRVEVGQEQLSDDLRAVAEGVTGNAEQLDRLEGRRWT